MKKWFMMTLTGVLLVTATACGSSGSGKTEKQLTKEGKTIVTVSIQESKPFYETLEKKFEEKHPDIDLQINSYKNIGENWGPSDFEKYKKTTNTAMLSGKGMDIIEVGNLPLDEFVSKDLLLDMNDLMGQDQTLNKNDIQGDILDVFKLNDGLYTIPSGFFLRAFVGDGDILASSQVKFDDQNWNWKEFEKTSKEIIQQAGRSGKDPLYALAFNPPEMTLQEMVVDNYAEFVDITAQKAKFDSPAFVELMQQVKKMYDEKVMTSEPAEKGNQLFYSMPIFSPTDFIDGPFMIFNNPKLVQKPQEGEASGLRVTPGPQFAIHAKTSVKDEAWKFMTFLLSEEAQSLQDREGFSLLKTVNEKQLSDIQEQVKSGTYKLPDGKTPKISDEQFAEFKQLVLTANQYVKLDGQVISIIGDESRFFFSGQKSAEEVAKLIQNRTTTYLNE